jgi:gliding motility-associated-like protein
MRFFHINEWFYSCVFFLFFFINQEINAQSLSAPGASFSEMTAYPVFSQNDPVYFFCGSGEHQTGSLKAVSSGQITTFTWEKFNSITYSFDFIYSETGPFSSLTGLSDGGYRVRFSESGNNFVFRAWIFNSWIGSTAEIEESNCESFQLHGSATGPVYRYYDPSSGQPITVDPGYKYTWMTDQTIIGAIQNYRVSPPPSKNSAYRLEVTDRTGCNHFSDIAYESIVPKSSFSWSTDQKSDPQFSNHEAPLKVELHNESENSDVDKYEWFLYRSREDIDKQSSVAGKKDSFLINIYDVNPIYTYENSGHYKIKLIAVKETPGFTCRDTFYLKNFIVVDTSLVKVAPVFTPNSDGINDNLIIKTRSLQSLDFQIFNRWGNTVHHFSKKDYIPENSEIAAWNGKINDKRASPGVYFYVVDAQGRDGVHRRKKGYIELIW